MGAMFGGGGASVPTPVTPPTREATAEEVLTEQIKRRTRSQGTSILAGALGNPAEGGSAMSKILGGV